MGMLTVEYKLDPEQQGKPLPEDRSYQDDKKHYYPGDPLREYGSKTPLFEMEQSSIDVSSHVLVDTISVWSGVIVDPLDVNLPLYANRRLALWHKAREENPTAQNQDFRPLTDEQMKVISQMEKE